MVVSKSIDSFYNLFDRQVDLVESYTEITGIASIIRMCRLKPYDILFEKYSLNLVLYRTWVDEYSNALIIDKKKTRIEIGLLNKKTASTDLYSGMSVARIASISKLVYFMNGKDEDTLKPHSILSFLGLDNYLRTFVLLYGEWREYPSLYLGVDVLQDIFLYRNIVNYKEIKKQLPVIYGCEDQRAWLSSLPLSDNFISIMGNENNSLPILLDIHKGKY